MDNPTFQPLQYCKGQTQLLRIGLLKRIEELSVSDYPTASPNQTIRFLQDYLNELSRTIESSGTENELRILRMQIAQLGVFLDWLDNAHTEQTPRGLVQLLKHLINLIAPNSRVIASPQAEYNYSIRDLGGYLKNLVDNYIPHSKQSLFDEYLSSPTKLISFPRIERDNILAHAIFGHELGHPIADEYLEQETIDTGQLQKYIVDFLQQELKKQNIQISEEEKLTKITNIFNKVLEIRKRALQELISDAVGIIIFGPSAFFACYELFWAGDLDALPSQVELYPPSRMRIRLMLILMKDLGYQQGLLNIKNDKSNNYVDAVKDFFSFCENLIAIDTDQQAINNSPLHKLAYDSAIGSLEQAIQFALAKTSKVAFDVNRIILQVPELIKRIEMNIPPNEIGDPKSPQLVDYRASLLSAWIYKLRNISPDTNKELSSAENERLQKLTLRAIEYVILQSEYNEMMLAKNGTNP